MVTPTWSWLLTRWSLEPSVIAGMAALAVCYLRVCRTRTHPTTHPTHPWDSPVCTRAQLLYFVASLGVLILALLSPLDYVGDEYLFSAHMVQHLLLATVWPPLLLLSLPEQVVAPIFQVRVLGKLLRWLTFPAVAFLIFNTDISIWHLPALYDLTLQNEGVHIFEHLTFMAAGLLAWWPVLSPVRSQRLSFAAQELYLFASLFPTMALGIMFSFFQRPLYSPYIAAPRLWGISALTDQQVGGLVMWMPGNIPYAVAMLLILVMWLDRGDPVEEHPVVTPATHPVVPS